MKCIWQKLIPIICVQVPAPTAAAEPAVTKAQLMRLLSLPDDEKEAAGPAPAPTAAASVPAPGGALAQQLLKAEAGEHPCCVTPVVHNPLSSSNLLLSPQQLGNAPVSWDGSIIRTLHTTVFFYIEVAGIPVWSLQPAWSCQCWQTWAPPRCCASRSSFWRTALSQCAKPQGACARHLRRQVLRSSYLPTLSLCNHHLRHP